MTWTALPINASAGAPAYAAQLFRNAQTALMTPHPTLASRPLGAFSGRRPGAWIVTAPTPGSAITVAPGNGILDVETPVATSAYLVASDANDTTQTLAARHATLDRIDGVYVQVNDTDVDGSGLRSAVANYVTGTPGSGTPPTTPARNFRVATVLVPNAGTGGATVVTMDQVYCAALGGILPVASSALYPASGYEGQVVDDAAANQMIRYSGSAWEPVADPAVFKAWTAYTPAWAGSGGGGVSYGTTGSISGSYKQIGKTVHYRVRMILGGTGVSGPAGDYQWTLPVAATQPFSTKTPAGTATFFGGAAPVANAFIVDATHVTLWFHGDTVAAQGGTTHPGTWQAGVTLVISGTYEAA